MPSALENDIKERIRVLLNFGEHGRELISSEIALRVLETLCDQQSRRELLERYDIDPVAVDQILQRTTLVVIPMENPNGRALVEGGALCERKNGRGVDPNRNWAVHWGVKEKDYDPNEEFPGSKPFSEPEAELLRGLATEFRPHVWLNVHSGMEAMFVPYDHKNEVPDTGFVERTLDILKKINTKLCEGKCAVGPGGKTVGYLAHGTATDYMHDKLGVGVAMTWEVFGDESAPYEDCFRMFNPLTKSAYDEVVGRWTAAVYALLAELPGHPAIPDVGDSSMYQSGHGWGDEDDERGKATGSQLGRKGGSSEMSGFTLGGEATLARKTDRTPSLGLTEMSLSGWTQGGGSFFPSEIIHRAEVVVLGALVLMAAVIAVRPGFRLAFGRLRSVRRRLDIPL